MPKREVSEIETVSQITGVGVVVWLLTQSPMHKNLFLTDLEWMVMTPILLNQYRVFHTEGRPVGAAFWAYLSEEGEQRIVSGVGRLAPQDWKAGDRLWLVNLVAPFGGVDEMIKDLTEVSLKDKAFKYHHTDLKGQRTVKEVG
ncbi:MAG: toxin-activating lysine-acyltransferase [Proteobacteria bacterium]|nr:toxin-activating lysine-acyltransferase [Pseudomonadota bacterium]